MDPSSSRSVIQVPMSEQAPTNMSSSTASLFAFDDLSSRQTLWFMNELVDLGRLETAYEAWVALEKTGIFRSAMAERWAEEEVCTDDMHPIERTHRMHRNWLFIICFYWRRVLRTSSPSSPIPEDQPAPAHFLGELLLAAYRVLGCLPSGPEVFDASVGFSYHHDSELCALHREADRNSKPSKKDDGKKASTSARSCDTDACVVLRRRLFLSDHLSSEVAPPSPLVSPVLTPQLHRAGSVSTVATVSTSLSSVAPLLSEPERIEALDAAWAKTETPGGMLYLGRGTAVVGLPIGSFSRTVEILA